MMSATKEKDHYDLENLVLEIRNLHRDINPAVPNPAPLGLFAFGFTTALLQIKHTGLSDNDADGVVILLLGFAMFFGGLLQIIAGLCEVRRNNIFGFTAFLIYGGFWMSLGTVDIIRLVAPRETAKPNPQALQAMLFLTSIISFIFWVCTFKLNKTLNMLFFLLTITIVLLGLGVVNETVDKVGGWFGMVTALVAFWLAGAELINDIHGEGKKEIIPVGKFESNVFATHGGFHYPGHIQPPRLHAKLHASRFFSQRRSHAMQSNGHEQAPVEVDDVEAGKYVTEKP
jgi:succinate-acetate transporter protein